MGTGCEREAEAVEAVDAAEGDDADPNAFAEL
jgi:hypothetical protein